jgi:hypothetical protein
MATWGSGTFGAGNFGQSDNQGPAHAKRDPYDIIYSLNKLANKLNSYGGITVGPLEAAAAYASIAAPYPEVVESLNRKAGNKQPNFRDLDGVCNQLAGTKDLAAQDALSRLAGN